MIRKILVLSLVAALAACGGKEQVAVSAAEAPVADAGAAAVEGYRPLPGGVELGLEAHLRSDRIYENKKGATRRKVTYEVLKGSQQDAVASVEQALTAAGYAAQPRNDGKNGAFTIAYKKKKTPTLNVQFNPSVGDKPANPAAQHLVAVDWQLKAAPKKK